MDARMIRVRQQAVEPQVAKRFEGYNACQRTTRHGSLLHLPCGLSDYCLRPSPRSEPPTDHWADAEIYLASDLRSAPTAAQRYCPVLATEPEGR